MDDIEDLLRRCAEGDIEAYQRVSLLVADFAKPVVTRNLSQTGDQVDVDDTLQQVWLAVFEKIRTGKGPTKPDSFAPWVRKIALYKCADYVRRRRKERKRYPPLQPGADVAESRVDQETKEKLKRIAAARAILESFHGLGRQILEGIMRGLTNVELCSVTGLSLGTLKRRKAEVLKEAKRRFDEYWEKGTDESDG